MNSISKLIIPFIISCSFISCEKTIDTSSEYWKWLVNETDKVFFYVVHTTVGSDSTFSYDSDSISFYFVKYGTVTPPPIGAYNIDIEKVIPLTETLYNLTDTSSFLYSGALVSGDWRDSLYRKCISVNNEGGSFYHDKYMETLVITDTLFSIMKKDYTMLDKFKEYYLK